MEFGTFSDQKREERQKEDGGFSKNLFTYFGALIMFIVVVGIAGLFVSSSSNSLVSNIYSNSGKTKSSTTRFGANYLDSLSELDISDIYLMGFASGGYFAVQMEVAYSSIFSGAAIIAGGPYYCAEYNHPHAVDYCKSCDEGTPNITYILNYTYWAEKEGRIDNLKNLYDHKTYIYRGKNDTTQLQPGPDALYTFYSYFMPTSNIVTDYSLEAEHGMPTLDYGISCLEAYSEYYILNCTYDGAKVALEAILGTTLNTKGTMNYDNLYLFNQVPYYSSGDGSYNKTGYIYIPTACQTGTCKLLVAHHGCWTVNYYMGDDFVTKIGYNEWAETNNIVILYPQLNSDGHTDDAEDEYGCWDWWGFTGENYALQDGTLMLFVRNMITAVSGV